MTQKGLNGVAACTVHEGRPDKIDFEIVAKKNYGNEQQRAIFSL